MIDYNMKKTSDLERLLRTKEKQLKSFKGNERERKNLQSQINHINAVLTGRYNTAPLDFPQ